MAITEIVISAPQSSVDFAIDPAAKIIGLYARGLRIDAGGDIVLRVSYDGQSFDGGAGTYAADVNGSAQTERTSIPLFVNGMGNSGAPINPELLNFMIEPGDSIVRASVAGTSGGYHASDYPQAQRHYGYRKALGRIQAVRVLAPSNFTHGAFYLVEA